MAMTLQCCICGVRVPDVLGGVADRTWSNCSARDCEQFICKSCDNDGRSYCRGHEFTGDDAGPGYSTGYSKEAHEREKRNQ